MDKYIIALINILLLGCFQAIGQGSQLLISEVTTTVATCNVNNGALPVSKKFDGSLKVTWTGGVSLYKVTLSNNSGLLLQSHTDIDRNWDQFDGLSSGDYSIKIEDALNNATDSTYTVLAKSEVLLSVIPYPVNCKGEHNGKIRLEVNSTTKFVTFSLNDTLLITTSDTNTTFTGLAGGNYKVKVTNNDGCIDSSKRVTVYEPKLLTASDSVTHINKYGDTTGQIFVVITGGASPYNFSFSDSNYLKIDTGRTSSQINKHGLTSGNYNFVIADANNCRVSLKDIFIWQPNQLILNYQAHNISCYGLKDGAISLSATGGYGNYTFGINDSITGTDTSFTNLISSPTPYSVFVRDSVGTETKKEIYISQPDNLTCEIEKVYPLKCNNDNSGAVKLKFSGGTAPFYISTDSIQWEIGDSIGNLHASNLQKFHIKDKNNCRTSAKATIGQPEALVLKRDSIKRPLCQTNDGAIYTSVTGGTVSGKYNFQWFYVDSSTTINNKEDFLKKIYSGEYIVKVVDDNKCFDTINVLVSNLNNQHFDSVSLRHINCYDGNDGEIKIFVSGGTPQYSYYLNDIVALKDNINLKAGSYKVKTIDADGCAILARIQLIQPDSIAVLSKITGPGCHNSGDGSISLFVSGGNGGFKFNWNTGDTASYIEMIAKGNYHVSISDSKNCAVSKIFELGAPKAPSANWPENRMLICTGNNVKLDGGDFLKHEWFKELMPFDTLHRYIIFDKAGEYHLRITDSNGCIGIDTFRLDVSDHPLEAVLLLPDSAFVGEIARAIDVTWPVPDSIKWLYDKPVQIDSTNTWSESFTSTSEGTLNVTLRTYYGGCFSDSGKTIIFHDTIQSEQKKASKEKLYILEYTLYPSPNNGVFNVNIKLSNIAQIRLSLYAVGKPALIDQKLLGGQDNYKVNFNNKSLKPGTYLLLLEAGTNKQIKKFIKSY